MKVKRCCPDTLPDRACGSPVVWELSRKVRSSVRSVPCRAPTVAGHTVRYRYFSMPSLGRDDSGHPSMSSAYPSKRDVVDAEHRMLHLPPHLLDRVQIRASGGQERRLSTLFPIPSRASCTVRALCCGARSAMISTLPNLSHAFCRKSANPPLANLPYLSKNPRRPRRSPRRLPSWSGSL